ncbi:hypothetical protein [Leucobacter massiliensis]|nr:hypothetical protein [Leucobacter massiliensis]
MSILSTSRDTLYGVGGYDICLECGGETPTGDSTRLHYDGCSKLLPEE